MKIDYKNQRAMKWGIMILAVLGFTVGIFLTFEPDTPRYSYWISMTDMLMMEVVVEIYFIYNLFLSIKRGTSKLPVAMHIGIGSTIGIFFLATVMIAVAFFLKFNDKEFDPFFLWVVIGKSVLLLLVIIPI